MPMKVVFLHASIPRSGSDSRYLPMDGGAELETQPSASAEKFPGGEGNKKYPKIAKKTDFILFNSLKNKKNCRFCNILIKICAIKHL